MRRGIKYIGTIICVFILFRGYLYRFFVTYSKVTIRNEIVLTDENLIKKIDHTIAHKKLTIEDIVTLSHKITSETLNFTFHKVSNNPNQVSKLKIANCIGYASLFNSIGNYIIKQQELAHRYQCIHWVGKLHVFGYNIHKLCNSPFFIDHDFNEIRDKKTKKSTYVDPSLRDYVRIEYVSSK